MSVLNHDRENQRQFSPSFRPGSSAVSFTDHVNFILFFSGAPGRWRFQRRSRYSWSSWPSRPGMSSQFVLYWLEPYNIYEIHLQMVNDRRDNYKMAKWIVKLVYKETWPWLEVMNVHHMILIVLFDSGILTFLHVQILPRLISNPK